MSDEIERDRKKLITGQGELAPCRLSKALGSKDFYIVMPARLK